ncbi:hypothetical protein D2Q93_03065 [Alicyclobacillaceae bacterium I2511]|nr:hypothetical protein D2Q93_03065 [Alicyclobacillaceae bacterium I2511]
MWTGGVKIEGETRTRSRSWGTSIVIAFFLFVAAVAFLESPITRVRSVKVTGNHSIPAQTLILASGLKTGMSLWQVKNSRVAKNIETAQPLVQSVTVKTDVLAGSVTLNVMEKAVVAIYADGGHYYNLLSDGQIYGEIRTTDGFDKPIVSLQAQTAVRTGQVPNFLLPGLCQQLQIVPDNLLSRISQISVNSYDTATVYLNDQFVVRCPADKLGSLLPQGLDAISYFLKQGYQPGSVDMGSGPPYRYTPFSAQNLSGGAP